MRVTRLTWLLLISLLLVSGCSNLPGLRVLTGQDTGDEFSNRVVAELDLVMADKTGATDPSLMAAADRIEAATGTVDVIEIRQDTEQDAFIVNMLFLPPGSGDTIEGQVAQLDALRRAIELTWQAALAQSIGQDYLRISLLQPRPINTLDTGQGFVGIVMANTEISREDAVAYLSGERNLNNFYNLIVNGKLVYQSPQTLELYMGTPNHPMFMISMAP